MNAVHWYCGLVGVFFLQQPAWWWMGRWPVGANERVAHCGLLRRRSPVALEIGQRRTMKDPKLDF